MLTIDNNRSFVVTPDDICDVFLLPRLEGKVVVELDRGESVGIMNYWKKEYGIDGDSLTPKLKDVIQNMKDGGKDFKQLFVIFALSSFLTPTTNRKVDLHASKSVVDVQKIGDYDWCSYVLKKLCIGVNKYNRKDGAKNVSGCVLLLLILYFHRLKWQGKVEPSVLPQIGHWTTEKLRSRIQEEMSVGVLGQGEWVLDTYPVTSKKIEKVEKKASKSPKTDKEFCKEKAEDSVLESEEDDSVDEVDELSRFIKFRLPKGEDDDAEVHKKAKDVRYVSFS